MSYDQYARSRNARRCFIYVRDAVVLQAVNRHKDPDWEATERFVAATAANEWAKAQNIDKVITVQDIESIEHVAFGHVDYMTKLGIVIEDWFLIEKDLSES